MSSPSGSSSSSSSSSSSDTSSSSSSSSSSEDESKSGKNLKLKKKKSKHNFMKRSSNGNNENDDSDGSMLDLRENLKPIGAYIKDRERLLDEMFRCIKGGKLQSMLPDIIKVFHYSFSYPTHFLFSLLMCDKLFCV
jgi:hypothetical protein